MALVIRSGCIPGIWILGLTLWVSGCGKAEKTVPAKTPPAAQPVPGKGAGNGASAAPAKKTGKPRNATNELHRAVAAGDLPAICQRVLKKNALAFQKDEKGRTPLRLALEKKNEALIDALLVKNAPINTRDGEGLTPLLWLLKHGGGVSLVKKLLARRAGTQSRDPQGNTALHAAVATGNKEILQAFLTAKIDHVLPLNWTNKAGETPLTLALKLGHKDMAKQLLEKSPTGWYALLRTGGLEQLKAFQKIAPQALIKPDENGVTALHMAARYGHAKIIEYLIAQGADVKARTVKQGDTPLHRATTAEAVNILLAHKADIQAKNKGGETPLHRAFKREVVEALLAHKADVNAMDRWGYTPLHDAAIKGRTEAARALLKGGAEPDRPEGRKPNGYTPLRYAVLTNHVKVARLLLKAGAAVSGRSEDKMTLLHEAVRGNAADSVALLLSLRKLDVNARDQRGETPLHKLTVSPGKKDGPEKCIRIMNMLVQNGADPNARDGEKKTPLHRLAWRCSRAPRVLEAFLKCKADVNAKDRYGNTALHDIANNAYGIPAGEVLLKHGADINARNKDGQTPLHSAVGGKPECVKFLLKHGADINARDKYGNTPLHLVVIQKTERAKQVVQVLLKHGARKDIKNKRGQTPLDRASPEIKPLLK